MEWWRPYHHDNKRYWQLLYRHWGGFRIYWRLRLGKGLIKELLRRRRVLYGRYKKRSRKQVSWQQYSGRMNSISIIL